MTNSKGKLRLFEKFTQPKTALTLTNGIRGMLVPKRPDDNKGGEPKWFPNLISENFNMFIPNARYAVMNTGFIGFETKIKEKIGKKLLDEAIYKGYENTLEKMPKNIDMKDTIGISYGNAKQIFENLNTVYIKEKEIRGRSNGLYNYFISSHVYNVSTKMFYIIHNHPIFALGDKKRNIVYKNEHGYVPYNFSDGKQTFEAVGLKEVYSLVSNHMEITFDEFVNDLFKVKEGIPAIPVKTPFTSVYTAYREYSLVQILCPLDNIVEDKILENLNTHLEQKHGIPFTDYLSDKLHYINVSILPNKIAFPSNIKFTNVDYKDVIEQISVLKSNIENIEEFPAIYSTIKLNNRSEEEKDKIKNRIEGKRMLCITRFSLKLK